MAFCKDKEARGDKDARKVALKGVNESNVYDYSQYKEALYRGKIFDGENCHIRVQGGEMRTVKTRKRALAGVHVKSYVQEDRVTTRPHKIQKLS